MKDINTMTKDELDDYARAEFGVDLDKRASIETLRQKVQSLIDANQTSATVEDAPSVSDIKYLLNPKTGFVFEATEHLLVNDELVPCDKDGNRV